MALWQNIPFFCIILCLFSAAVTSVLKGNAAKRVCLFVLTLVVLASGYLCAKMAGFNGSYTFMMGHFPAPWGNELRVGLLEAATAVGFSLVMLLSLLGGDARMDEHIGHDRKTLYYVVSELLTAALLAQVYTNDLFTAYVFVEIMTIAACALIAGRTKGRTLVASARYMIMNLLGSGLFLLGITLLYDLTGHLLMSNIKEAVAKLYETGAYSQPLTVVIALLTIGLAVKSALFPFHTWVPDAYSYSTPTSSAILSSLVSKGYIFLLIKIYDRVIGMDVIAASGVGTVLLIFSLAGIVIGSLDAIREKDIRRMIAFSSVAQIGYIYLGVSLGSSLGMAAALFQILSHAAAKSMLFLSTGELCAASNESKAFKELRGAGRRSPLAGAAFTVGAFSMVGVPFTGGFVAKVLFAQAATALSDGWMLVILLVLALSTFLNTIYFLRTVITLYRPAPENVVYGGYQKGGAAFALSMALLMLLSIGLGVLSRPVVNAICAGLSNFG